MKESTQVLLVSSFILPPSMFHININETCIYLAGSFAPPATVSLYYALIAFLLSLMTVYRNCTTRVKM